MYGVIPEFRGEHYFLSNYYIGQFQWRRQLFTSGEQAFSYAKTFFAKTEDLGNQYRTQILNTVAPGDAKKLGRKCPIDVDQWDKHRISYMREIVHAKFSTGPNLVGPLLNTGAKMLVEGNNWNDQFWGRCKVDGKWVGLNMLGVILMEERGYWLHSDFKDKK